MGDLCPHDTARLDRNGILDRHGVGEQLYVADTVLDICTLETLVGIGESSVDLFLDRARFIDQIHQLADQDIPFFIHQVIALFCKCQRILRKH